MDERIKAGVQAELTFGEEGQGEPPPEPSGRDEMNLCEYPIALLADRAPKDQKTVHYHNRDETLTITGSDLLGLPTALDIDVIIALMALTKAKTNFESRTVRFTRYELLRVLGWADRGYYYKRLSESLNRWVGVMLIFKRSWWDNELKTKGNKSLHILETANVVEQGDRKSSRSRRAEAPLSYVRWSEEFFRSFQANNLKRLDLDIYFSLESSITKQLYRFLDKRFYKKPAWSFDVRTLACEHIGMTRNYETWRLKQKLQPAIEELTEKGFLTPADPDDRFTKTGKGEWTVHFQSNGDPASPVPFAEVVEADDDPEPPESGPESAPDGPAALVRELVDRGVTEKTAVELASTYPANRVARQIENLDFEREQGRVENAGAWLAQAIRADFAPSTRFVPRAERDRQKQAGEQKERGEAEEKRRQAQSRREEARRRAAEREIEAKVGAYWEGLSPAEQKRLTAEALKAASPETIGQYEAQTHPTFKEAFLRKTIRGPYLRTKLGLPLEAEPGQGA